MAPTPNRPQMNVLVLSHTSDITGGAELSMLDVFDSLCEVYNIRPTFILREPLKAMANALKNRGWKYHSLPYTFWSESQLPSDSYSILKAASVNNKAIRAIEDIIQSEKPDIVLTNSVVCPWAAIAAYTQGMPHVWFVREYGDLDHGREFLLGTKNTFDDVGHLSDLVVTNSLTLQDYLSSFIESSKLTTLYTPFNIDVLSDKASEKVTLPYFHSDSLKLCITAGSVVASKGQLDVVRAAAELNKHGYLTEVCIVGHTDNKDYYDKIVAVADEYNILPLVHFVGFHRNPLPFMKSADIGIMTSRMEAFGRVTFEYLALGKPVVGANSGATPEMVHHGKNGYLFTVGDASDLYKQLLHYAKDRTLILAHSKASKAIATSMMSKRQNIDNFYVRLVNVYQLSKDHPRPLPPQHLIHHWLDYPTLALKANGVFSQISRRHLKAKIKDFVRPFYNRARSLKAKVTGK